MQWNCHDMINFLPNAMLRESSETKAYLSFIKREISKSQGLLNISLYQSETILMLQSAGLEPNWKGNYFLPHVIQCNLKLSL